MPFVNFIPTLNEAATFRPSPEAVDLQFQYLSEAVVYAADIEPSDRHPRAEIRTASGAVYGWDAINQMRKHIHE